MLKREKLIKKESQEVILIQTTIEYFVNYIIDKIKIKNVQDYEFDFAILDETEDTEDLEIIRGSASGWYGVHTIDTGFEDNDITFCCDYWGGHYPQFAHYWYSEDFKDLKEELIKMICETLTIDFNNPTKDLIIIGEIAKREDVN